MYRVRVRTGWVVRKTILDEQTTSFESARDLAKNAVATLPGNTHVIVTIEWEGDR